jgi:hypothetical protein
MTVISEILPAAEPYPFSTEAGKGIKGFVRGLVSSAVAVIRTTSLHDLGASSGIWHIGGLAPVTGINGHVGN